MNKKLLFIVVIVLTFLISTGNVNAYKKYEIYDENKIRIIYGGKNYDTNSISTYKKVSQTDAEDFVSEGNVLYFRTMVNLEQFCKQTKICQLAVYEKGKSYMLYKQSAYQQTASVSADMVFYYMFLHEIGSYNFLRQQWRCSVAKVGFVTDYKDFQNESHCTMLKSERTARIIDVPSEWHNGKPYVPIRFLASAFNIDTGYDSKSETVSLYPMSTISAK